MSVSILRELSIVAIRDSQHQTRKQGNVQFRDPKHFMILYLVRKVVRPWTLFAST